MSRDDKHYSESGGSPIKIEYPRPTKQTEEGARYRQPRTRPDEDMDDGWTEEKRHTSAIRYDRPVPPRRSATADITNPKRTQLMKERRPFMGRLLLISGLLLLALALGMMAFNALADWWQRHTDDMTYGMPRTSQTDQYVGHGDSPTHPDHFIALNLNGAVEVMEINPQNIKLDHAYYITNTDPLNPVTLSFPTVDGKQYMYINIGDSNSAYTVVTVNDGKEFVGEQH